MKKVELSKEHTLQSVIDDPQSFPSIPRDQVTKEMCAEVGYRSGELVRFIPTEFFDQEFCNILVLVDRAALHHIPDEFKTVEMCARVVWRASFMISAVPEELKDSVYDKVAFMETRHAQGAPARRERTRKWFTIFGER